MGTSIPTNILSLKGQRVNKIDHDHAQHPGQENDIPLGNNSL
jgi:hypothetical protein